MNKDKILEQLDNHKQEIDLLGITKEKVLNQIQLFEKGTVFADLVKPCTVGDGILVIDEEKTGEFLSKFSSAAESGRMMKFVPASGAATRMFHPLHSFIHSFKSGIQSIPEDETIRTFINQIRRFAFFDDLMERLAELGIDPDNIRSGEDIYLILKTLLDESGLNFSFYPKGAIPFHRYKKEIRTPFEEHIHEAAELVKNILGEVKIHFTISEEHKDILMEKVSRVANEFEDRNIIINLSYSFQKKSTHTISLTHNNQLFLNKEGKLLFRPAGHGALIENLNELDADIIFIKNIDNILPSTKNSESIKFDKILAGCLVSVQDRIFSYLREFEEKKSVKGFQDEIISFSSEYLSVYVDKNIFKSDDGIGKFLFSILNRPLRVCGMVKNEGHPGGGPFWVRGEDGRISIQIIESSQVDKNDSYQFEIFKSSTHFNPVDMICGLKDYKNNKFDLTRYVDPRSGLITEKTFEGEKIKVLELPGLWNGAMAGWNTIFVEIPSSTFNPVKVVNDLLDPAHQT